MSQIAFGRPLIQDKMYGLQFSKLFKQYSIVNGYVGYIKFIIFYGLLTVIRLNCYINQYTIQMLSLKM